MPSSAGYIVDRLQQHNVEALFGVPAVYCAELFEAARRPGFRTVVTSSDLEAGYAADAYARLRGLSAVSVAYGVGTLSLINAIAGAYVERSPVFVVNGGPTNSEISTQGTTGILFSHSMGLPHSDLDAFRPFTAFCERVTDLADVPSSVDRAIVTALSRQHPVYLEVSRNLLPMPCPQPVGTLRPNIPAGTAAQAAQNTVARIKAARKPILIVGIEVQRYRLAAEVLSIINKLNLRWTTTLLARSTLSEQHPGFLGVFNGEEAPRSLLQAIADADLVVALGTVFARGHRDIMLPQLGRTIRTWDGKVFFPGIAEQLAGFPQYVGALDQHAFHEPFLPNADAQAQVEHDVSVHVEKDHEIAEAGERDLAILQPDVSETPKVVPTPVAVGLTYDELFDAINDATFLDASFVIIPDTFLGIFSAASADRLRMPGQNCFISSALWASIGHSVGAAVGAGIPRERRPLVICGDGGFQMTAQALSAMARMNMKAIVIVVDNGLHGYEQYLLDRRYYDHGSTRAPRPYVELSRWEYCDLAVAMGVRLTEKADSVASLTAALARAKAHTAGPSLVHAIVQSRSLPPDL